MQLLPFEEEDNFFLMPQDWGMAPPNNIIEVLRSCRNCFFELLDKNILPQKPALVYKSEYPYPWIRKGEHLNTIFLEADDFFWAKYAYQFSHELCHHVINTPIHLDVVNCRFGWFEESICELASLCNLYRMSYKWSYDPPYPNWMDYHSSLLEYANNIILDPNNKVGNISQWFSENQQKLYSDRYLRDLNRIVAVRLFPLFNANPKMWILIQYLKDLEYDENTSFIDYLRKWNLIVPSHLQPEMVSIHELFVFDIQS